MSHEPRLLKVVVGHGKMGPFFDMGIIGINRIPWVVPPPSNSGNEGL